jgi:DNA-binding SARP family transcriptional activator
MRFRVLGPLEVNTGEAWTSIGAAKWRSLLAYLLLSAGQPVSTDSLIDAVWGDNPPARATNLISIYVLRLRRLIGDTEGQILRTRAPGYQLQLGRDDLDSQQFGHLTSQGREALTAGHPDRAAELLADALALWRGRPLADVPPSDFIEAEADRLDELRLSTLELRIEADMACGRHGMVIPDLRRLLADQPLKEGLWLLLMRALEGAGRRAEALTAYDQARTVISDELGVAPGPELRKFFQQLLSADLAEAPAPAKKNGPPRGGAKGERKARPSAAPETGAPPRSAEPGKGKRAPDGSRVGEAGTDRAPAELSGQPGAPGIISLGTVETGAAADDAAGAAQPTEPGPMQLPADISDFTGRDVHVEQLCQLLAVGRDDDNPGAVPVALVAGAGGLGKTTLAVHAAHRMRSQYPDGVLYVDLLGASPQPLIPADVLARFLQDLGVRETQIPVSEEQRAALYRTRLNGRRTLIVLDNARDAAQVRPLLPGSASCAVIVTSRSRLPDLVGGGLVHLDVLDDSEALALFSRIVGAQRTAAEPDATAELLVACAGLPLAIRISAARLASRSSWTIRWLADQIGDEHRRLDELKVGDLAVRASFEVSFSTLPAAGRPGDVTPAHAFRMLGLWHGPSIGLGAAAALIGQPESEVADALEMLFDAHLLESPSPYRYRFHDLLRVYAAERAEADELEQERTAGLRRLLSWYMLTADAAAQVVSPYRYKTELDDLEPGCHPRAFATADQALAWYDGERASLVAATRQAASLEFDDAAWQLAASLYSVFYRRGNWADCVATHRIALISARRTGNRPGEAWVLNNLGEALAHRHGQEAVGYLEHALAIRREIGDSQGEAQAANNLANVYLELGRPQEALDPLERSLLVQQQVGHRYGEGIALHNLGEAYLDLGRFDEAIQSLQEARIIFTQLKVLNGEGWVLHGLGRAHFGLGRTDDADRCLREALAIRQSTGDRRNQAVTLRLIGEVSASVGNTDVARSYWNQALSIFRELGDEAQSAELTEILDGGHKPPGGQAVAHLGR